MVPAAPRYDAVIFDAIQRLDDRREPIAEVHRRVAAEAERLGFTRPSYVHVRRLVHAERARRDAVRELVEDTVSKLVLGLRVDAYEIADRVIEARRRPPS